jgi:hypothetical protein
VIASSGTALSNLAYLIGAVVLAVIGGLGVWLRHRQPKSVDANMASFRRGLSALAPDTRPGQPGQPENRHQVNAIPGGLTRIRIERDIDQSAGASHVDATAAEAGAKSSGGEPG